MTVVPPHDGDGDLQGTNRSPGSAVVFLIMALVLLLMGFSITTAILGQATLAAMAGAATIGIAVEVIRRVLTGPSNETRTPPPNGPEPPDAG
jgi:hypothetical protein